MKKTHKKTVRHAQRHYMVILEPEEVGGYSAYCPALPGCYSQGETLSEATRNIQEAVELYCETLQEDGKPLPKDEIIIQQAVASAWSGCARQVSWEKAARVARKVGFALARQKEFSHATFYKRSGVERLLVVIPMHRSSLKPGTLRRILKDLEVSPEVFEKLAVACEQGRWEWGRYGPSTIYVAMQRKTHWKTVHHAQRHCTVILEPEGVGGYSYQDGDRVSLPELNVDPCIDVLFAGSAEKVMSHVPCSRYSYPPNGVQTLEEETVYLLTKTGQIVVEVRGGYHSRESDGSYRSAQGEQVSTVLNNLPKLDRDRVRFVLVCKQEGEIDIDILVGRDERFARYLTIREHIDFKLYVILTQRESSMRIENRTLRDKWGILTVGDPARIHVIACVTGNDKLWRWRMYVPSGRQLRLFYQLSDKPLRDIPRNVAENTPVINSGEFSLEALLRPNFEGKLQFILSENVGEFVESMDVHDELAALFGKEYVFFKTDVCFSQTARSDMTAPLMLLHVAWIEPDYTNPHDPFDVRHVGSLMVWLEEEKEVKPDTRKARQLTTNHGHHGQLTINAH